MLPLLVLDISILELSYSNPLINRVAPSAYPSPLFWTTKWEIVFSLAILTVFPASSCIVSPGKNLPDNDFTNNILPVEYTPVDDPSTTPYALLLIPNT